MTTSNPTQEVGNKSQTITLLEPEAKNKLVIDKAVLKELRVAYNQAIADKAETFEFQGFKFLPAYVKYMLEYIEERLI